MVLDMPKAAASTPIFMNSFEYFRTDWLYPKEESKITNEYKDLFNFRVFTKLEIFKIETNIGYKKNTYL